MPVIVPFSTRLGVGVKVVLCMRLRVVDVILWVVLEFNEFTASEHFRDEGAAASLQHADAVDHLCCSFGHALELGNRSRRCFEQASFM